MRVSSVFMMASVLALTPGAFAQAFATNHLAGNTDGSDALIMFDPSSPSRYTTIGSTGVPNIGFGGLDFDANGNLWAYASYYKTTGGAASGLYSIDPLTGQATPVGQSFTSLQDLAYNPVDGKMYGINTQQAAITRLYEVDLATGSTTQVGSFTGLPEQHYINGLGIDSQGNFYLHDVANGMIFQGDGSSFSSLYDLDVVTVASQGLTIDWSRDDTGYHTLVGQGEFPNYISTVNSFSVDGSGYFYGDAFGPNNLDGIPPVQAGDIAIMPAIPAPGGAALMALAGAVSLRRRRSTR
ncbi:MAG: SMP-30/gluconolactonase/LRE family protein [Phycisphaerales bacterium JB050]